MTEAADSLPYPLVQTHLRLRSRRALRVRELMIKVLLGLCGLFSVAITLAIVVILATESFRFFQMDGVSLWEFATTTEWSPRAGHQFGIWALLSGTMLVTVVAMGFALPAGLVTAIYLSEYAPAKVRTVIKPTLEVLAGIPTVVYGFFALTIITPGLRFLHDGFSGYNAFSAGIAVGILCLPTVCSLAEDALRAVPRALREGALGLGATRFDVTLKVVVPAALSGIISAFLLAMSRAIGETMIVALAAGISPKFTADPRESIQTMTGYIVTTATGDLSATGPAYYSIYAVGGTLFLVTLALTMIGGQIRRRFRETYS